MSAGNKLAGAMQLTITTTNNIHRETGMNNDVIRQARQQLHSRLHLYEYDDISRLDFAI